MGSRLGIASVFILTVILASGISSACIGEVAGKVSFNITPGANQTQQMVIFNSCHNQTIYFTTLTQITPIANVITPTVVVSPSSGVLAPNQYLPLNIITYMPANAAPGTDWKGATAAGETSNQTAGGGASFNVGVLKVYDIVAAQPKLNVLLIAVAGAIIVGLAAAAGVYYYVRHPRKAKRVAKKETRVAIRFFKKEKRMTYSEFKAMEKRRRATRKKSSGKRGTRSRSGRRPSRRRR